MAEGSNQATSSRNQKVKTQKNTRSKGKLNTTADLQILEQLASTQGLTTDRTDRTTKSVSFTNMLENSVLDQNIRDTHTSSNEDWETTHLNLNDDLRRAVSQAEAVENTEPQRLQVPTAEEINTSQQPGTSNTERVSRISKSDINIAHEPTTSNQPLPVDKIESAMILSIKRTPFIQEDNLDRFKANTYPLQKFIILRNLLGKIIRTHFNIINLKDSLEQGNIPQSMKATRDIQVIDPDVTFNLEKMKIAGEFENSMLKLTLEHYKKIQPRQTHEFHTLWTDKSHLTTKENVLIRLKLVHYKNELIQEKERIMRDRKERREQRMKEASNPKPQEKPQEENNQQQGWEQRPQPQRQTRNQRYNREPWNRNKPTWNVTNNQQ